MVQLMPVVWLLYQLAGIETSGGALILDLHDIPFLAFQELMEK